MQSDTSLPSDARAWTSPCRQTDGASATGALTHYHLRPPSYRPGSWTLRSPVASTWTNSPVRSASQPMVTVMCGGLRRRCGGTGRSLGRLRAEAAGHASSVGSGPAGSNAAVMRSATVRSRRGSKSRAWPARSASARSRAGCGTEAGAAAPRQARPPWSPTTSQLVSPRPRAVITRSYPTPICRSKHGSGSRQQRRQDSANQRAARPHQRCMVGPRARGPTSRQLEHPGQKPGGTSKTTAAGDLAGLSLRDQSSITE